MKHYGRINIGHKINQSLSNKYLVYFSVFRQCVSNTCLTKLVVVLLSIVIWWIYLECLNFLLCIPTKYIQCIYYNVCHMLHGSQINNK